MIDMEKLRLGIALPCINENMPTKFVDSFFAITRSVGHVYLRPRTHGPIDSVRNELVDMARAFDVTHIWFCDTDQIYPQNVLNDLLKRMSENDIDILAAKVHRRYPPYDPILYRGTINKWTAVSEDEWTKGGLVEVDSTGMGSVLIDMKVFEKIDRPYFQWLPHQTPPVGEDAYFYGQVKKAGFKIFVDCDISIGHLATMTITEDSYFAYKLGESIK